MKQAKDGILEGAPFIRGEAFSPQERRKYIAGGRISINGQQEGRTTITEEKSQGFFCGKRHHVLKNFHSSSKNAGHPKIEQIPSRAKQSHQECSLKSKLLDYTPCKTKKYQWEDTSHSRN